MNTSSIVTIGLILLLAWIPGASSYPGEAGESWDYPALTVMGEGTISVPADTVTIAIEVMTDDKNVTRAQMENEIKLEWAIKALESLGISQSDVIPGGSSSSQSARSSVSVCRTVNNTTVCDERTSSDSSMIGKSALVRTGASDQSRIKSILDRAKATGASASVAGYGLIDASSAVAEARKIAVESARANAIAMADAAGVELGRVLDISDYQSPEMGMVNHGFSPLSSEPGMVDVTSHVVVTYEISNPTG